MSMKATIRQVDTVAVVDISGRITLGEGLHNAGINPRSTGQGYQESIA